jgi:hypothetical protein
MLPMQATPFAGVWRGLMRRQRLVDYGPLWAEEAKNVDLYGAVLAKRAGTKRISTTQLGSGGGRRVHALFQAKWRAGTGTDEVLAAAGTLIQAVGDPPSGDRFNLADLPAGTLARTTPTHVHFAQLDNLAFIVDGTNLNLKYLYEGGSPKLRMMGISAPVGAPAAAIVAGGTIADVVGRTFRYTYVNSLTQAESEPSPASSPRIQATGANGTYQIPTVASPDPQVDRARIYATTDGGDGIWLFLAEVNDGATYNWTAGGDSTLGSVLEEFVNDPPPSPLRLCVSWPQAGLLLGVDEASPSVLRYTDLVLGDVKPESWPPGNVIFVDVDSGDEIVAIWPFVDSVLVIRERSAFRIRGIPPDIAIEPIQHDPNRTAIGGFGQHALAQVDDVLASPFLDGCYTVGRFVDIAGGFQTSRLSAAIDDLWGELNAGQVRKTHAVFHRKRKQLRVWMPHGALSEAQRCLVYQLDLDPGADAGGWTVWEVLNPDSTACNQTASLVVETPTGDLVYVGTSDGYVLQMDQGLEDSWSGVTPGNGAAYPFEYASVPILLAEDGRQTRMRFLRLVARATTQATLVVTPETDFGTSWPTVAFSLAPLGQFIMDASRLDVDRLGPLGGQYLRAALMTRGAYQRLRFRNNEKGVGFQIHRWELLWQPLGVKVGDLHAVQAISDGAIDGAALEDDGFGGGGFGEGGFN